MDWTEFELCKLKKKKKVDVHFMKQNCTDVYRQQFIDIATHVKKSTRLYITM